MIKLIVICVGVIIIKMCIRDSTGTGQPQSRVGYYDATVNMNWQVDVFGSIRQRVKAQKENFAARCV